VTDKEEREQRKEFLDRCFEFLKHITTVGTAAALLILAIFLRATIRGDLACLRVGQFGAMRGGFCVRDAAHSRGF
jgi:hypothetical protein